MSQGWDLWSSAKDVWYFPWPMLHFWHSPILFPWRLDWYIQSCLVCHILASIPLILSAVASLFHDNLGIRRMEAAVGRFVPFSTCTNRSRKVPKKWLSSTQFGIFTAITVLNRYVCRSSLLEARFERFFNHTAIVHCAGWPRHLDGMPLYPCASSRPVLGPTNRCRKDEVDTLGSGWLDSIDHRNPAPKRH